MEIDGTEVGEGRVYVIAEAGINHTGDPDLAREFVNAAAESGADAVKFQTFDADRLVTPDDDGYEEVRSLQLDPADYANLQEYANKTGITFLSTPFDPESADLLADLDVPAFKIGSGELTDHRLLRHVAEIGAPMIVSTGMGTLDEIREARAVIRDANADVPLAFLECTSAYPTPIDEVNLRRIGTLDEAFPEPVGFSDHTTAEETLAFAVAAGAVIVEKHFTVDGSLPGPDQDISLEPDELERAASLARTAASARGRAVKEPTIDAENRDAFRKSLHATRDIDAGEQLSRTDVAVLRPGTGLAPKHLADVDGATATRDIEAGTPIGDDAVEF